MSLYRSFFLLIFLSSCYTSTQIGMTGAVADLSRANADDAKKARPRNVVLMIGDGMGLNQLSAAMYSTTEPLAMERIKTIGIHKSHSADDLITDSAAGATAFACGVKTNNSYLGLDAAGKKHTSLLRQAGSQGIKTGLVVSSTIVHATPAAFFAYNTNRNAYDSIAADLPDARVDFLVGGGKKYFDRRKDDTLNLITRMREQGYFVTDYFEQDYASWAVPDVPRVAFFTADGDPLPVVNGRDYLPKASADALNFLSRRARKGFFLMIEGSQIDWGGHANDAGYVISEMIDFDRAVRAVLDFAERDGNTLVVITGDHDAGGLTINGGKQGDLVCQFSTVKHTGGCIPVYAYGPGAETFSGIYDNTQIYHKLKKLLLN